jgi:hypothetical protein
MSIGCLVVVFLFVAGSTVPTFVNNGLIEGDLIKNGRYAITNPGLESVGEQHPGSIIAIGSSIMQYATDGKCISAELNKEQKVYNFAIGGANPYTEMIQVPQLIEANPGLVLLDLGPNALWAFSDSESMNDYVEFRFTVLSLTLPLGDEKEWQKLIRERDKEFIATDLSDRISLTNSYSQKAVENLLESEFHHWIDVEYIERDIPGKSDIDWFDYLETPNFLSAKFEAMDESDILAWFEENMPKRSRYGVYNPHHNGTLNHAALEYTIRSLTEADIEVLMVAVPHHPLVYDYLEPGQIDGHNSTLSYFEETYGATPINWFWETWDAGMFRDRNHLGDAGREYYCERISDVLNEHLR